MIGTNSISLFLNCQEMKTKSFVLLLSLVHLFFIFPLRNSQEEKLTRKKRFLLWQPGNNWVQLVVGIGIPAEVDDHSITWGTSIKAFYLLPDNISYYNNPTITFARRRRRATSRWDLYRSIIYFVERSGLGDGKACLLRAICEVAEIPLEQTSGLFAEILHALLTPSSTPEDVQEYTDLEYHAAENLGKDTGNCDILYPECEVSLISKFTKIITQIKLN